MIDLEAAAPISDSLSDWQPFAAVSCALDSRGLVLTDLPEHGYHVLQLKRPELAGKRVRLSIVFEPTPDGSTALLVHHWGGADVFAVAGDGTILHNWFGAELSVHRADDGGIHVEAEYPSSVDNVLIGTFHGAPDHLGMGTEQLVFKKIVVAVTGFRAVDPVDMLSLVDVGAAGGLQPIWTPHMEMLDITLIEPADRHASFLKQFKYPRARLIQAALFDRRTRRDLNIARLPGCSSLLEPDFDVIAGYSAKPCFETIERESVKCTRFDFGFDMEPLPVPEFIKIDTQGVEFEVLTGFGDTLHHCLALELEAHFYPLYKNQRLLGELVTFLATFGIYLRRLNPIDHFDGEIVEADVLFTRRPDPSLSDRQRRKLDFIERLYGLGRNRPVHLLHQIGLS